MPKLRDLRPVDAEFAHTGENQRTLRQDIPCSAAALFRALADAPTWKEWLGIDVEWTSPEPHGVGATRTVRTNGLRFDETFLEWDTGTRMAFRFERSTLPMTAFAEDYVIGATGDDTCQLEWSYAHEWSGPLAPVMGKAFDLVFTASNRRGLGKLAKLMANTTRFDESA